MNQKEDFYRKPTHPHDGGEKTPSSLPEYIGPYKVEALLDKGGMSYLYLGRHPETQQLITIKVLSQKFISNTEVIQRFLNEAEIIAMTDHPNIIHLYGHGEWEEGLYISMEYVEGISLRKYLLQTPISLKRSVGMIIDIAYALCHLHTHGVIHRDLKPENILVTENGTIKVIDFGIAQLLTEKMRKNESSKNKLIGTPIYISPEQKENPENVSYPSDIYSLGIISYELILGRPSHGYIHLSLMPKGIQPILQTCLQPNPENRYQDIVDFITDISSYLNSPSLQNDRIIGDHLSEFSEELRQVQTMLAPPIPTTWPEINIGIASTKEWQTPGVYDDFFRIDQDSYAVIMGESSAQRAEGLMTIVNLRGMVRALFQLVKSPTELVKRVNDLLFQDHLSPIHNFNYLIFHPKQDLLTYISCGNKNLWHIPSDGTPPKKCLSQPLSLGVDQNIDVSMTDFSWTVGDTLILSTVNFNENEEGNTPGEEEWIKELTNNRTYPPQQQADNLLSTMRIRSIGRTKKEHLTFICIKRTK
ncbi:MAG: protein kinase [Waddliaceae bacterium]